jgi:peptide deformylase
MINPIVLYGGHDVLTTKTKVSDVNDKDTLNKLIQDMKDTLESIGGLGLTANQIGRNESVCLVWLDDNLITMINPQIVNRSGEKKTSIEGCLSLPDITAKVERDETISVKFVNPDWEWQEQEIEVNFPNSVVIQHEIDHLNGVLMIDNLTPLQRSLISTKLKKTARGNTNINYVGMIWRDSVKSWSLVGPYHKLLEFYNYRSNSNSFLTNGEVDGSVTEGEIIINEEEGTKTQEDTSGEITEHEISQDA